MKKILALILIFFSCLHLKAQYGPQFGNSITLTTGNDDYIEILTSTLLSLNGDVTVEAWINMDPPTTANCVFMNCINGGFGYTIFPSVFATVNFGNPQNANNSVTIPSGSWHHIAGVKKDVGINAEFSYYVDGVLTGTGFGNAGGLRGSGSNDISRIGRTSINSQSFKGRLDEIRVWNTGRTQAEIAANMFSPLAGNETGLIGYWDMNRNGQGAGLTVDNKATATGAALNGTTFGTATTPVFGPGFTQQKPGSGNAISFDGVDDFAEAPHSENINFGLSQDFVIETWVKIPVVQQFLVSSDNIIIDKWEGFGTGFQYPFSIRIQNSGSPDPNKLTVFRVNDVNNGVVIISLNPLNDNKWHHIAFVKNATVLSLYVDGILNGTASDVASGNTTNTARLLIGRRGGSPLSAFFTGQIDEIRIWNTALTLTQICDRMCHKITSSDALYSNLVAYYNFDEGTGNTAFDGTVNANNGTLTNAPTRVTSGAAIGNASSHDYVNAIKTTSITHPTGESFTVTSTSGNPDGIQVYRIDEQPNTLTGTSGVGTNNKYFGVFQVNGTAPQYTAVYNYSGNPSVTPGIESQLRLNKRSDNAATSWTTMVAIPNEPANTITVTGESTEYILGTLGFPLPLNLISFTGSKQNNDALLQWKTANETGVSKFEVQRSDNGQTFTSIGTVAAGGLSYSLADLNAFSSRTAAYYRLKSIDMDARFTYSNVLRLSKQTTAALTVYPNPVSDVLTISGLKEKGTILLFNTEGKLLQQQTVTAQTMTMDMSKYPKGIYLLQYKTKDEVVNQKIIRQ